MDLIRLRSDNWDTLLTLAAYRKIVRGMSTAEYLTHSARTAQAHFGDVYIDLDREGGGSPVEHVYCGGSRREPAPVVDISSKEYLRRELTPRERLVRNQRRMFGIQAQVTELYPVLSKTKVS